MSRRFGNPGCYANFRPIRKETPAWKRAVAFFGTMALMALAGVAVLLFFEALPLVFDIKEMAKR